MFYTSKGFIRPMGEKIKSMLFKNMHEACAYLHRMTRWVLPNYSHYMYVQFIAMGQQMYVVYFDAVCGIS
jgi:hypothetical protein